MENNKIVKKTSSVIKLTDNFLVTQKGLESIKDISGIRAYEPVYITVPGKNTFLKERKIIKEMYTRQIFNLIHYINEGSLSFTCFLRTGNDLEHCLKRMEEDVENEFVPFKYGVFLGMNLDKIRRFKNL